MFLQSEMRIVNINVAYLWFIIWQWPALCEPGVDLVMSQCRQQQKWQNSLILILMITLTSILNYFVLMQKKIYLQLGLLPFVKWKFFCISPPFNKKNRLIFSSSNLCTVPIFNWIAGFATVPETYARNFIRWLLLKDSEL